MSVGRWLDTVTQANTRPGELIWMPIAKGGTRAQVVMMSGREFAVLRPKALGKQRQWSVRIEGFLWSGAGMLPGSVADKMGIKESPVGAFATIAKARAAVVEAHNLLIPHLQKT